MSPTKIAQAFNSATASWILPSDPQLGDLQRQWLALSSDQVDAAWEKIGSHGVVVYEDAIMLGGLALGAVGYALFFGRLPETGPAFVLDMVLYLVACAGASIAGLFLVAFVLGIFGLSDLMEQARLLAPASTQSRRCVKALQIVEGSGRARAYRDTVVSLGRDLRGMDLVHLENEARRERWERPLREKERVCKELHGLSSRAEDRPASQQSR